MSKKPPSQLKSDTARANGAKSQGPKSAATREISSRNSLRHGLTAYSTILLACESQAEFDEMAARYTAIHQPATAEEESLVKEMIAARWRIQRLWTVETSIVDMEMIRLEPEIEKQFAQAEPGFLLAAAIRSLTDGSRSLSLISRYESRLQRIHERNRKALRFLQDQRKKETAETAAASSEPTRPTAPTEVAASNPASPPNATQPPLPEPPAAVLCQPRKKVNNRTHQRPVASRFRSTNRLMDVLIRSAASRRFCLSSAKPA